MTLAKDYTMVEVAEALRMSERWVRQQVKDGAVHNRYGHKIRLHEGRLKIGIWLFRRHGGKVVFWGRFVSILRTWAAFLAGANHMEWSRFLFFNAAGGTVWATLYSIAYYEFGGALRKLSTTIDVVLGVAGTVILVAFVIWTRRKEAELQERAEQEVGGSVAEELGAQEGDT